MTDAEIATIIIAWGAAVVSIGACIASYLQAHEAKRQSDAAEAALKIGEQQIQQMKTQNELLRDQLKGQRETHIRQHQEDIRREYQIYFNALLQLKHELRNKAHHFEENIGANYTGLFQSLQKWEQPLHDYARMLPPPYPTQIQTRIEAIKHG